MSFLDGGLLFLLELAGLLSLKLCAVRAVLVRWSRIEM